jgi:hypothetical protein
VQLYLIDKALRISSEESLEKEKGRKYKGSKARNAS